VEALVTRGPRKKSLFGSVIARKPEDQVKEVDKRHGGGGRARNLEILT
jgi:hypothetical protein